MIQETYPGIEALADIRDGPDESDTITVDELLDLENDVLCSAAETNERCYSFALSDLAASSAPKSNEFNREEEAEEGDVDDDDPRHCHLFQKGNCKYANPAFKPPKTTHWIGCDYPGCDNWFHEPCLNIEFSSDLERDTYAFVCTSHGNVKGLEQYKDLVAAENKINSSFLALGYTLVTCSWLIVSVFFFALVPLAKSIFSI